MWLGERQIGRCRPSLVTFDARTFGRGMVRHSARATRIKIAINLFGQVQFGPCARVVVAKNVEDLHSDANNINKQTALTQKGEIVSGRSDPVNMHDILTGSDPQGLYSTAGGDTTCGNWMKSGDGSAIVGHHDRTDLKDTRAHELLELLAWLARLQPG